MLERVRALLLDLDGVLYVEDEPRTAGDRAYLYARSLLGVPRSVRLRTGTRASGRICDTPQGSAEPVCETPVETGPTALDLRGRRLAFAWETRGDCAGSTTGVWLDTVGAGRREIQSTCSSNHQGRAIVSPTISAGRVHYAWSRTGGEELGSRLYQYRIETRARREVFRLPRAAVLWTATDAGRTFYLLSPAFPAGCAGVPISTGFAPPPPCQLDELTS